MEPKDTLAYEVLLSSWQVRRIYLDELLASTPSSGVEDSLGLKIMEFILEQEETAVASARNLIERVSREVASGQTEQEMLELIETVALYKLTQFTREELQAMIYTETEFKQSRLYQSIKLEGKLEAVNRLLALGLSAEQVAGVLELTVEQVRQAAQSQYN